ncbi:VOC family protein [Fusibacter bizertensis]
MKVVPYFYFNGNCELALNFYQEILGGQKSEIMRYKDQNIPGLPPEKGERILHAELSIGNDLFYFSDTMGDDDYHIGDNVQINLNLDSEEEITRIYNAFTDGAQITMPLQETFWNAIYGTLVDKFGISWSFNFQKI